MEIVDDEYEEEEVIVYANFEEGSIDREIFQSGDIKFKVIGLDSDTPIIQLGDRTFKGSWNDTIGTRVFFEEDPFPPQVDHVFTVLPPKMLRYKCMSTKTLDLSRFFLKAKTAEQCKDKDALTDDSKNTSFGEQDDEVLKLAQSTVNPDSSTSKTMEDIVTTAIKQVQK